MIMDSCASWKPFTKTMSRTTPKTIGRNPHISNIKHEKCIKRVKTNRRQRKIKAQLAYYKY